MLDKTEYSRLVIKRTNETGSVPTIPPITADTLNQFTPTDIMVGEFFLNQVDDLLWIRTENEITPIQLGTFTGATGNFEIRSGQTWTDLYSLDSSDATYIDWDNGNVQELTLTVSPTIYLVNGKPGGVYKLIIKQSSGSTQTVSWNTIDTEWAGGITPVMSTGASVYDVYNFVYNGTTYLGDYTQNYGAVATPTIITTNLYTYFDGSNPLSISGDGATTWTSISGSSSSVATLENSGVEYTGDLGGGVSFDGLSGYCQTSTDILPNSGFTYEVWVRQTAAAVESSNTRIYGSETTTFEFVVNGLETGYYTVPTDFVNVGIPNDLNGVYLMTITYDLSELKIYRNGVEIYVNPSVSFIPTGDFSLFGTGAELSNYFEGIMYKIRTYSAALTPGQVLNNWNVERGQYGY